MFDWVAFDKGQARFCGSQRDTINGGGGNEIFAVQLNGGQPYYGQFKTKYDASGEFYNVEIVSFGYGDRMAVGLPSRRAFVQKEIEEISNIISELMLADFKKPFPLNHGGRFLGQTLFSEGWIRAQ